MDEYRYPITPTLLSIAIMRCLYGAASDGDIDTTDGNDTRDDLSINLVLILSAYDFAVSEAIRPRTWQRTIRTWNGPRRRVKATAGIMLDWTCTDSRKLN